MEFILHHKSVYHITTFKVVFYNHYSLTENINPSVNQYFVNPLIITYSTYTCLNIYSIAISIFKVHLFMVKFIIENYNLNGCYWHWFFNIYIYITLQTMSIQKKYQDMSHLKPLMLMLPLMMLLLNEFNPHTWSRQSLAFKRE